MKIFCKCPTVNISKLTFWLVICIAKNFIWTTLKAIFSIFRFFCNQIFKYCISAKYCPILTHHTSMESFQMMYKSQFQKKWPLWLVLWSRVTYKQQYRVKNWKISCETISGNKYQDISFSVTSLGYNGKITRDNTYLRSVPKYVLHFQDQSYNPGLWMKYLIYKKK